MPIPFQMLLLTIPLLFVQTCQVQPVAGTDRAKDRIPIHTADGVLLSREPIGSLDDRGILRLIQAEQSAGINCQAAF